MMRNERTNYTINGVNFEYATYEHIEQEELFRLFKKIVGLNRYVKGLKNTFSEKEEKEQYNVRRIDKHKSPNYYIAAIKTKTKEKEEILKKYEK